MITLNDYLYNGDTIIKIMHNFEHDLRLDAQSRSDRVDLAHADYIAGIIQFLEHNDFLTSQSQRIRDFYKLMAEKYPFLAFTFKGRIKSLIRSEEKFDRYVMNAIEDGYHKDKKIPSDDYIISRASDVRDIIAYRIVISLPVCHVPVGSDMNAMETEFLYEIADMLPDFLRERGFEPEIVPFALKHPSEKIKEELRPYYKDYVTYPTKLGYKSIHISFLDKPSKTRIEVQIRTKEMDDYAEIGFADHVAYENGQKKNGHDDAIPEGFSEWYDEAYTRLNNLQNLELKNCNVNMFTAVSNILMNDGCGLYRGRLILPYEHLSRFQNDLIG